MNNLNSSVVDEAYRDIYSLAAFDFKTKPSFQRVQRYFEKFPISNLFSIYFFNTVSSPSFRDKFVIDDVAGGEKVIPLTVSDI